MLKKGDIILAAAILIVSTAGFFTVNYLKGADNGYKIATIKHDNKTIRRINLDTLKEPENINITGDYNIVISVEKGRIRFLASDCPDKTCVKTGWLDELADTAVCLPNRTIIIIEGNEENNDGVDVTTY